MTVKIYHNPRCSKSRQTLQLLKDQGINPQVIEYLKTPPTITELDDILTKLAITPRELMRRNEAEYQARHLDDSSLSQADLLDAIVQQPILLERPIVVTNDKAAIGRPPEAVLKIL